MYLHLLYFGFKVYCFLFRPIRTGIRVLMEKDNQVWLVRHTYMTGWFMPGGGLKRMEALDEAARREALEETGATLGEISLLGVFTSFSDWKTDHTAVFLCRDFEFTGKSDAEIAEMRAFPLDDLPENIYPPNLRLLKKYRDGTIASSFGRW
ncbi:MAG: NUDIX domain-containing protein [Anaerolineales bacterium]|nr:NUDIX domain-containing protein [Anaerolineales bacterium]